MPEAIIFLLRAVVLVLLWGFVAAAIVAIRHDLLGTKPARAVVPAPPRRAAAPASKPAAPKSPTKPAKSPRSRRSRAPATNVAIVEGDASGTSVPLSGLPITIGRAGDSTIVLSDDYASNHHARLVPRDGAWLVEDTGSTNGTFVDDKRVTEAVAAPVGTRIRIGRTVLEIR